MQINGNIDMEIETLIVAWREYKIVDVMHEYFHSS